MNRRQRRTPNIERRTPNAPTQSLGVRRLVFGTAAGLLAACAVAGLAVEPAEVAPTPYLVFRNAVLGYDGPDPDHRHAGEIRIGWFGPAATNTTQGDMWWAAQRALEDNRASADPGPEPADSGRTSSECSGLRLPFVVHPSPEFVSLMRLLPCWALDPWGSGVAQLARMVYVDQPIALVGSVDSATTHLAEQIAAKASLPLVSPVATDPSVTLAGVPWMFSCAPSDTAIARTLVEDVFATRGATAGPVVLLATTDHESRMTARAVVRELSRRHRPPNFRFDLTPGVPDLDVPYTALARAQPSAVVIIAGSEDAARLVRMHRERFGDARVDSTPNPEGDVRPPFLFGTHTMARPRFRELAGGAANGVRFPVLATPRAHDPATAEFMRRFVAERGHPPGDDAWLAYDATRLLAEAIRRSGPSRARLRDALAHMGPWLGIAGTIHFDGTGQNTRTDIRMATFREGTLPGEATVPQLTFTSSSDRVRCYEFVEVTIQTTGSRATNPFTDVTVSGSFGPQGDSQLRVDGFCDAADGTLFRIRFMPSKPGPHTYTVSYREGAFEGSHTGRFEAFDDRKRGMVRVDPEYPSHFRYEGTQERYFWNGTTAYWLAGWDDETIGRIIDRLDRLKVTRIRAALSGRVRDGRAWFEDVYPTERFSFLLSPWVSRDPKSVENPGHDVTRFDVSYWRKWERLLAHARARDMAVSVVFYVDGRRPGVDPFGQTGMGGPDERRYYRYAIARLAAYCNVMWDLANEYRLFRDDAWAETMGAFVKEADPYDHLTSTHGHGDFRFGSSAWADFAMYQSWDEAGGYDFMVQNRRQQARLGRAIPQVNEEYGYEDHYPQGWGGNRTAPARAAETRARIAWEIYLAGGYQTTGERANRGTGSGPDTGGGWINGRGDDEMTMLELYGHLYDFFTGITWWKLAPDTNLVVAFQPAAGGTDKSRSRTFAARSSEGDLAAVYVPGGGVVTLNDELLKDQLKPLWFSPRDGGMRNARALRPRVYRTPTAHDWVLLFRTPCNCSFRDFDNEFER